LFLTQFPLQKWYSDVHIFPGLNSGGSLFYYAIFSALISAVIQELLKLIPIVLVFLWKRPKQFLSVSLGVFCGLGFGIYEACSVTGAMYQSGAITIHSWAVFERIFSIIFHATTGAALGYGINRGFKHLAIIWLTMVAVHSFSSYLVVFLQKGIFDVVIFELFTALIYLLLVLGVYIMIKMARR
jgi:RsiW-degrading membrane proteinase PrsW (M82 family)